MMVVLQELLNAKIVPFARLSQGIDDQRLI